MVRLPLIVLFSVLAASSAVSLSQKSATACDTKTKDIIGLAKRESQWGNGLVFAFKALKRITFVKGVSRAKFLSLPITIIESVCQISTVMRERSMLTELLPFNDGQQHLGVAPTLNRELGVYKRLLLILNDFYSLCRDHKATCGSGKSDEDIVLDAAKKSVEAVAMVENDEGTGGSTESNVFGVDATADDEPAFFLQYDSGPKTGAPEPVAPLSEKEKKFGKRTSRYVGGFGYDKKSFSTRRAPTSTCKDWYAGLRSLGFELAEALSSYVSIIGTIQGLRGATLCPDV